MGTNSTHHKLNSKLIGMVFLGLGTLGLSGCVFNVGESWDSNEAWAKSQEQNRNHLAQLTLGMSKDQVMTLMGTADFSEAYQNNSAKEGAQSSAPTNVLVLFYRTQRTNGDGKTTKDECTPVVLANDTLIGWGETAYGKI